jgi:Carboxypeptidase regulatory-like domain
MKTYLHYAILSVVVLAISVLPHTNAQTGNVKGKVKERNGKSLEGVVVRATSAKNKDEKHETKSDSQGEFEFSGLSPGDYSFSFEKQGFKSFTTRKLEVPADQTIKLNRVIELSREGEPFSLIRGAVLHGVGYSLSNASVLIERIDGGKRFKQETISREGGEFAFRVRAEKARYRITASARGFEPASTELEIDSDEVRNVALTLQQAK